MTPRRDVEGEIYAQLYGEPSEPQDPGSTRVIDGDHRTHPVREEPEPEPPSPLEALGLAAAARARSVKEALDSARAQGLRDALRSTRATGLRDAVRSARAQGLRDALRSAPGRAADGLAGRERRLTLGALAVALIGLVLIAGLSSGSGDEPPRVAGPPPGAVANELAADSEARKARAREARSRKARRRRAAAKRRREERTVASVYQAPADDSSSADQAQTTDVRCPEDSGCVARSEDEPRPTRDDEPRPTRDDEEAEQSDRRTVRRPRVRVDFDDENLGGRRDRVRDLDFDFDVDDRSRPNPRGTGP